MSEDFSYYEFIICKSLNDHLNEMYLSWQNSGTDAIDYISGYWRINISVYDVREDGLYIISDSSIEQNDEGEWVPRHWWTKMQSTKVGRVYLCKSSVHDNTCVVFGKLKDLNRVAILAADLKETSDMATVITAACEMTNL